MKKEKTITEEVIEELKKQTDKQLIEQWERKLCFICDYGGPCSCSLAGRVLAGRGHVIVDRYGKYVEPI